MTDFIRVLGIIFAMLVGFYIVIGAGVGVLWPLWALLFWRYVNV